MTKKPKDVLEREKRLAGGAAVRLVRDGMRVGLGTGSTAEFFIRALGERVGAEGLRIEAVATSGASEKLAEGQGIRLIGARRGLQLDLTVDGADAIDADLNLVKGAGGAMLREKVVAQASRCMVVIGDSSKLVDSLCRVALPVEVVPFALPWVADAIAAMGGEPAQRPGPARVNEPWKTDQGNFVLDCTFRSMGDPAGLGARLAAVPGLVAHGLFIRMAYAAIVADGEEVFVVQRGRARGRVEDLRIPG